MSSRVSIFIFFFLSGVSDDQAKGFVIFYLINKHYLLKIHKELKFFSWNEFLANYAEPQKND